jgi:hypothetical protein
MSKHSEVRSLRAGSDVKLKALRTGLGASEKTEVLIRESEHRLSVLEAKEETQE